MRSTMSCLGLGLAWLLANAGVRGDSPWGTPTNPPIASSPVIVQLGRPEPISPDGDVSGVSPTVARLGAPAHGVSSGQRIVRGQGPDAPPPAPPPLPPPAPPPSGVVGVPGIVPPPPPPPPGADVPLLAPLDKEEAYNCGIVTRETSRFGNFFGRAWDNTKEFVGGVPGAVTGIFQPGPDRRLFQTDHRFDAFAAPVSFPFYATPPQATTEAKLLFLYDNVLPNQQAFPNQDNYFLGGQLRLAVTDWLTLEVNKLGGMWVRPPGQAVRSGFSELWLGPKFTLIKNDCTGSLLAAGLVFQVPIGSANIFQDTGSLSLAPYVSVAQKFFPDFKYGSIILWNTTGYAFRTDNIRSEYLYSVFHVNWDILNLHMFYPEFGVGWNLYTRNGNAGNPAPNNFEGNDWFNFGNPFAGRSNLSLSTGLRWKINEHLQTGFAFQFGVLRTPNNWEDWGATVDFRIIY